MKFTELVPIRTAEEFEALKEAAIAEEHLPLWASHYMRRGNTITGFAGIESVPFVHLWSSVKHMAAADSFSMLNSIENLLRMRNHRGMIIPAHETSTFTNQLGKAGYKNLFQTNIHFKAL